MNANIDLSEGIANRVATMGDAHAFPSAGMVLTDLAGNWSMQQALLTQSLAKVPYTPGSIHAVEEAIAKLYPLPRLSPFRPEEVIGRFELADISAEGLVGAVDMLSQLSWPDRRTVLKELATQHPGLETVSYLAQLQPKFDALPDVDTAVRAAWMATRLVNGKHEVTKDEISNWVDLASHIVELPYQDMVEIFHCLNFRPEEVDGLVADMVADLDDLEFDGLRPGSAALPRMIRNAPPPWFIALTSIVKNFDRTRMDFLEFNKPSTMPYGYFIGTAIHTIIAAFYRAAHIRDATLPGDGLWTNTTPVDTVFNFLRSHFSIGGNVSALGRSAALTRPDIFELVSVHGQPPGWVFEIKPAGQTGEGIVQAVSEASMYAAILSVWKIPAILGPESTLGTFGTVPAPGGWVAFACPAPGAIVYKLIKVPNERYRLKFPQTADARERARVNAVVAAGAATAATAATAYMLWQLIAQYGWVLAL